MNDAASGAAGGGPFAGDDAGAAARRASADDVAVVEALRRGDEEAFVRLVERHHAVLRRIARLYGSSPAAVDDVVQDTWLAVIRGVWAFEGRSTLKTWILRILINRARTHAQREGRTVPFADAGGRPPDPDEPAAPRAGAPSDAAPSPEAGLLTREAAGRVRAAIEALPPSQRLVITMRDLEECSSEEVRNVLGVSETNQRVLLHRARSRVRAALAGYLQRE